MANPIDQYDGIFKAAGAEWNVDPIVLKALALHESGGRVDAVGTSGEQGLMQIMPSTQRQLGVTAPFNAEQSIYGGAKYLAQAMDAEHDNPSAALMYYNGGPGWRTNRNADPKYPSYVGVQYQKLAKADTGTLTDATPAPPGASPAATAQADAPDYNNAPAAPPAKPAAAAPDPYDAALTGKDASGGKAAEPDAYTKALGTPAASAPAEPPAMTFDEYGRPLTDGVPPSMADQMDAAKKATAPTKEDVTKFLAPAPNTTYGDILPLAKDNTTGAIRLALPNIIRNPLIGLTEGPGTDGTFGSSGVTWNPETGTYGLTPEAASVGQFAATPLRFSGKNPLQFEPPGMLERKPLTGDAATSILNPDAAARVRAAQGGPVQVPPPTVPTPFNTPTTAAVPGVSAEAAAAARNAAGPTSLPTGVPGPAPTAEPIPPVSGGSAPPLSPGDHQWAGGMRDRLAEIQQENQEAGIPGSVGAAATPQQLAQLTQAQMKAYRAQAELGEILAPPEPGMDRSIYVHGSEPTRAEYMGDPAESQKESLYRERDPNAYGPRLKANNQARVNSYEDEMGTQPQLQDLRDDKALAAEKDGAAYMRVAGPLDLTPRLKWLDQQLADPRIQESPSRMKVLGELRDALFDADGKLKTDPGSGWGAHDDLVDRLDKSNDRTAAERYSQKLLVQYKKIVDGVNNTASNGAFQTFLDNQTGFAQKINSMEQLQGFRGRLTNRAGDINGAAFHKFVADLAARRARPGVDPAMGISDDTMHAMINIDKDLKRTTNIDLGKSRGSQTNLFGALAQATGIGLAHAGALAISHGNPTANLFLQGAMSTAGKMTGNVLLRRAVRRGLSPPPGGYDYNPLTPPSAP